MSRRLLLLTIALLMFPQLAQTLYSPALADLAERFALPPSAASQAMSLYLFGFAAGVLLWGAWPIVSVVALPCYAAWPCSHWPPAAACWPAPSARSCWHRHWPHWVRRRPRW